MRKKILLLLAMMMVVFACAGTSVSAKSVPAKKLTVSCKTMYLKVGQKRSIGVIVSPANATSKVKYSSSKTSVAAVNSSGKITARKAGTATITVKAGSCKKKIKVTVLKKGVKVTKLKFDQKKLTVEKGTEKFLSYTVKKAKATSKIKWESSNPKIVSVTQTGKIKAKKKGTAKITISANGQKATCTVRVTKENSSSENSNGTSSSSGKSKTSSSSSAKSLSKLNLTVDLVYEMYSRSYIYTGSKIEPLVRVYNDDLYLYNGTDYTLSYSNNINAGTATITIKGIGKYKGSIKKNFTIEKKAQGVTATLSATKLYIGETAKINVTYGYGDLTFTTSKDGIVEIDSKGKVTAVGTGTTYIYVEAAGNENYYASAQSTVGSITVTRKEATVYGFSNTGSTYKHSNSSSRMSDGTNKYTTNFYCDAEEEWLDDNVTFTVEDVTPTAYHEMFTSMGISCTAPKISLESATVNSSTKVREPCTSSGAGNYSVSAIGGKKLTITAGNGVRAIKVYAKKGGTVIDSAIITSNGKDSNGNSPDCDQTLYKNVRAKVEEKLWDSSMSNYEKLNTLANYISGTTHYPNTPTTSKEYNPTFWDRWSVDDKKLFYDMADDTTLNAIMKFQGGITTCVAANVLSTVAQEDLGLPYLYDGTDVAKGEGVWVCIGSYSSNPSNASHYSLKYKYPDESTVFIDAQGIGYSDVTSNAACEVHGCMSKLISLN